MNNKDVQNQLAATRKELSELKKDCPSTSPLRSPITRYAIIKACGTLERSFKGIIADYCDGGAPRVELKNYVEKKVRGASANPSYANICGFLQPFDPNWNNKFKALAKGHARYSTISSSLKSLVDLRNEFAHGGNPSASLESVQTYYIDATEFIKLLDRVVR